MDKINYIPAEAEQYFSGFATSFMGRETVVKYIERKHTGCKHLGFTKAVSADEPIRIYLCKNVPLFDVIPEKMKTAFMFGILVHEILHQVYTDFCEVNRNYKEDRHPGLFLTVFNIFEDARIEYHAEKVFGGDAISALALKNDICFVSSGEVDKIKNSTCQLMSALIQIKYAGKYKGTLSAEAEACFSKIIGLYSDAVKCREGKECVRLARKAACIIAENLDSAEEFEDQLLQQEHREETEKGQGNETVSNSKGKTDVNISETGKTNSANDAEDAESSGEGSEPEAHSDTEGSGKPPGKGSLSEAGEKPQDTDGGEKNQNSRHSVSKTNDEFKIESKSYEQEKEIQQITEKYSDTADNIDRSISESCKKNLNPLEMESVFSDGKYSVITEKAKPENELQYKSVAASLSKSINMLVSKIIKETATEPQRISHTKKGRPDIERISSPSYTGTRFFKRKIIDGDHSAALLIAVDISGSMSQNNRYAEARKSAIIIAEAFAKAKIPVKIIGYTTTEGNSEYEDIGYHKEYVSWKNTLSERSSLLGIMPMKNNMDGPTIRYCIKELDNRREKNKALIVISDGCPNAYNYQGKPAVFETADAVKEAKKHFDVLGISLTRENPDAFSTIYGNKGFVCLSSASELPDVLSRQIRKMSEKW